MSGLRPKHRGMAEPGGGAHPEIMGRRLGLTVYGKASWILSVPYCDLGTASIMFSSLHSSVYLFNKYFLDISMFQLPCWY